MTKGILIGDWAGLAPVYYKGNGHLLTVAPIGVGKGATAVIPNALRYDHLFLCDFGGENTAVAIREWRRKGMSVYCINPWKMHAGDPWALPSHSLNVLDLLDPDASTFVSDAGLLAEMATTRTGRESGSAAYFKDEAQSAIKAFLMHARTAEPPERQNLATLRDYVTRTGRAWKRLLDDMIASPWGEGVIAREAGQLRRREEQAPEEFSAIVSTLKQDTNFLDDPLVRQALSSSEVRLDAVKGDRGAAIALIIPLEHAQTNAPLARLVLGAMLLTMQRPPLAREKVLFVLDEFAALGKVSRISNGLATLRKYRVWLWPIFQTIAQIRDLYGDGWQNFIGTAELRQFLGAWDHETAEYVSRLCGETTITTQTHGNQGHVTTSETRRLLVTPEEVLHAPDGQQIAFVANMKPMRLIARPYWERPELRGRFHRNPFHGAIPRLPLVTPLRLLQGAWIRTVAWWLAPSKTAAMIYIALLLWGTGFSVNVRSEPGTPFFICSYVGPHGLEKWTGPDCPRLRTRWGAFL